MPARPQHGHGRGVGAGLSFPVVTLPLHPAPCDKIIVPLLLSGESLLKRGFQACNLKCPETSLLACSGRWALGPWVGGWALPWGPSRPSPREASEHSTRATRGRRRRTVCGERARRSAQWGASDTALQGTRRRHGAPARASRTYSRARSTRRAKLLTSRRRRVEGRRRRNVGSEGEPRGATFRQPPGRAAGRATGSEAQPLPGSAAGRGSAVGPDSGPGDSGRAAGPAPCRPRLCEPRPRAHRSTSLEGLAHARGGGQGLAQTRSPKGGKRRRRSSVCRTVFYDEGPGPRRGWGRRVPPREIKTSHGVANRTQSRGGKEGEAEGGQGAGRPRPRATPRVLLTLSDSAGRRGRGRRRETADAGGDSRPGRPAEGGRSRAGS